MRLFFAKDKIADKISSIVVANHAALLGTDACLDAGLAIYNALVLLLYLSCPQQCRLTVYEPILCRFVKVVTAQLPVAVYDLCLIWKVLDKEVLRCIWVLDYKTEASLVASRKEFQT